MTRGHPGSSGDPAEGAPPLADWRDELASGRFGAARHAFVLAGQGPPEVGRALAELAEVEALVRDKAWSRAVKRFERIEDRPDIVPWGQLGADLVCLQRSGEALDRRRPDDALSELEQLRSGLVHAEAETQRGTALIYDDRLDEAAGCFERALEADPRHFRALTNLGNIALEEGRIDDAIAAYERALKLNESFANAHHNLAVAYRRKGELGKSVRSLRRAQRLMQQRDASDARERLGSFAGGRSLRMLRWLLYAAVAIALYVVLHSRGVI